MKHPRRIIEQKNDLEKKEFQTFKFECKELPEMEDDSFFYFEGYLSTYGSIDLGNDIVEEGAFDESLKRIQPELLWQHKYNEVIGVFEEIKSDSKGLWVKGKMPKTDSLVSGRVIPQMKVGSVRSMSIGYWAKVAEYDNDTGIRTIKEAVLYEGSLVSQPMNPEAQVTNMKAFGIDDVEGIKTKRDFEALLRESGAFSNKSATYLASRFQEEQAGEPLPPSGISDLAGELKSLAATIDQLGVKK
jgi:HK97 family phage prohead protease